MKIPDAFTLDDDLTPDTDIHIGYAHTSLISIHRPDIAYPKRRIKPGQSSIGRIDTNPCPCSDNHVEVWVRRIPTTSSADDANVPSTSPSQNPSGSTPTTTPA